MATSKNSQNKEKSIKEIPVDMVASGKMKGSGGRKGSGPMKGSGGSKASGNISDEDNPDIERNKSKSCSI